MRHGEASIRYWKLVKALEARSTGVTGFGFLGQMAPRPAGDAQVAPSESHTFGGIASRDPNVVAVPAVALRCLTKRCLGRSSRTFDKCTKAFHVSRSLCKNLGFLFKPLRTYRSLAGVFNPNPSLIRGSHGPPYPAVSSVARCPTSDPCGWHQYCPHLEEHLKIVCLRDAARFFEP